jgi:hypothetical protein
MTQPVDYTIEVFCDDPSHARGKVAKIEMFHHEADSSSGSWWFTRSEAAVGREDLFEQFGGQGRSGERTYRRDRSYPEWPESLESVHRRYDDPDPGRQSRHSYRCKLCGRKLPANDATLFRVLDLVASSGESRVTIKQLHAVASNLPSL